MCLCLSFFIRTWYYMSAWTWGFATTEMPVFEFNLLLENSDHLSFDEVTSSIHGHVNMPSSSFLYFCNFNSQYCMPFLTFVSLLFKSSSFSHPCSLEWNLKQDPQIFKTICFFQYLPLLHYHSTLVPHMSKHHQYYQLCRDFYHCTFSAFLSIPTHSLQKSCTFFYQWFSL